MASYDGIRIFAERPLKKFATSHIFISEKSPCLAELSPDGVRAWRSSR